MKYREGNRVGERRRGLETEEAEKEKRKRKEMKRKVLHKNLFLFLFSFFNKRTIQVTEICPAHERKREHLDLLGYNCGAADCGAHFRAGQPLLAS